MSERLKALTDAGVSIWLDDLSRERIETGNLAELIKDSYVVGVTTNPTIFATALSDGERYDAQVRELAKAGKDVDEAIFEITTTDVRDACDVLADTFAATDGIDGRVSIEVSPGIAHDQAATVEMAKKLWAEVDRPNLFIKIPATTEGGPAITEVLAEGISVNVTLIFGLGRYDATSASRRRATRRPATSWAWPASPTRGWPTGPTRRSSPASGSRRCRPTAPTGSVRSGRRPA